MGHFKLEAVDRMANGVRARQTGTSEPFSWTLTNAGEIVQPKPTTPESWRYTAVPIPLTEGAEWNWTFCFVRGTQPALIEVTYRCKAGRMEDVTVPAGTFGTRSCECKGAWSSGPLAGAMTRNGWFSPDLNVSVRIEEDDRGPRVSSFTVTQLTGIARR